MYDVHQDPGTNFNGMTMVYILRPQSTGSYVTFTSG